MSTLHTLAKSPDSNLLSNCQQLLASKDALLLIEDGVYYASRDDLLVTLSPKQKLYALREDINARGLQSHVAANVEVIGTRRFVELCCEHKKVVNWF